MRGNEKLARSGKFPRRSAKRARSTSSPGWTVTKSTVMWTPPGRHTTSDPNGRRSMGGFFDSLATGRSRRAGIFPRRQMQLMVNVSVRLRTAANAAPSVCLQDDEQKVIHLQNHPLSGGRGSLAVLEAFVARPRRSERTRPCARSPVGYPPPRAGARKRFPCTCASRRRSRFVRANR